MDTPVTSVDFHFDIMCPWAYQASIATTFQPYLEARDWITIQKDTP